MSTETTNLQLPSGRKCEMREPSFSASIGLHSAIMGIIGDRIASIGNDEVNISLFLAQVLMLAESSEQVRKELFNCLASSSICDEKITHTSFDGYLEDFFVCASECVQKCLLPLIRGHFFLFRRSADLLSRLLEKKEGGSGDTTD